MPVGPHILWEKARKSASRACTSTLRCGTDCASTSVTAPTSCARRMISAAGLIVPRTLDMCVNETSFGLRARSKR